MTKGICALITITTLCWPCLTFADNCNWWQSKLSRTERNINGGGNQSQVKQWNKERNYYAKELEKCNKSNGTHRWIETTGARAQDTSHKREPLRTTTTDTAPPKDEFKVKRSLKDCVKPNNKIDSDVKQCMQGLKPHSRIISTQQTLAEHHLLPKHQTSLCPSSIVTIGNEIHPTAPHFPGALIR